MKKKKKKKKQLKVANTICSIRMKLSVKFQNASMVIFTKLTLCDDSRRDAYVNYVAAN